jgi:biopolymer transport protein ExbD
MAQSISQRSALPISEINTTPLIDVMLVLLIMFIITIPAATNTTQVELPSGPGGVEIDTVNTVSINADGLTLWNGEPVDEAELSSRLAMTTMIEPEPQLRFEPDAQAPYGKTAYAVWLIKRSGVTNFGFVGNEQHRNF